MQRIHPTAIIEEGAQLGSGVEVGPYAFISKNAKIGEGSVIRQGAIIDGDTTIGKNCEIFYNAVIGSIPQDLKYKGEDVKLVIGDNTTVREFAQLNAGTKGGGGVTKVGNNCLIMAYVHLAHDVILEDNVILVNAVTIAGHVEVGRNTIIGGVSAVHQFCKIGEYAMIGGGSILTQDLPPYCLCEGNRAEMRGLNLTGLRRNFENKDDINALRQAYKTIFRNSKPIKEAAAKLKTTSENDKVAKLCDFVLQTERGIPFKRKNDE